MQLTEDEMVGWHHWLNGREFEQTPGADEGQGGLAHLGKDRSEVRRDMWLPGIRCQAKGKEIDHVTFTGPTWPVRCWGTSDSLFLPARHQSQPSSTCAKFMVLLWPQPSLSPPGAPGLEQPQWLLVAPRIRSGAKAVFSSHNCYFHSKGHRGGSPGRTVRRQKASSGWGFFPLVMAKLQALLNVLHETALLFHCVIPYLHHCRYWKLSSCFHSEMWAGRWFIMVVITMFMP